ncbi:MAG: DUF4105 domain-containing protein [Treponema sp.]|nr:DUF4105 domain-containing protein [Treponema sp.]
MTKKIAVFFIFLIIGACLFADGDELTIKVAVVGPGDELYFWWGHIALVVDDASTGQSYFFDYGLFSFDQENFFLNFALGRLLYSCGVSLSESNYRIYKNTNRSVVIYTLDLPPETRVKVRDFAVENVKPENRDYFYHHFNDNCSTRIRDIIDFATDGQFGEKYKNEISRFTFRDHVRRHTWYSPTVDWFLNFLMGQVIDRPITVWDDMFLPSEVSKWIEDFYYIDINGERRKLVSEEPTIVLTSEGRPVVLDKPRTQWPYELFFSLVLSVIFGFFFFLQARKIRAGKILAGISMSITSLFFGFSAVMLYFLVFFTNHDYTFQNMNMIYCTPLLLAGVPFGIGYAITKKQDKLVKYGALLRLLWFLTVLGIFISMLLKLLPWFYHKNLTDQMLMLPIALLFTFQPVGLKDVLNKYFPKKKT